MFRFFDRLSSVTPAQKKKNPEIFNIGMLSYIDKYIL